MIYSWRQGRARVRLWFCGLSIASCTGHSPEEGMKNF
jgi:hypothetical protein